MFEQGLAEPLHNRTDSLTVHDFWIYRAADVVDRDVAHQRECSRFRIDLDLADMTAIGPGDIFVPMQFVGYERSVCREFTKFDAAIRPFNDESTAGVDDVLLRYLQMVRGASPSL